MTSLNMGFGNDSGSSLSLFFLEEEEDALLNVRRKYPVCWLLGASLWRKGEISLERARTPLSY